MAFMTVIDLPALLDLDTTDLADVFVGHSVSDIAGRVFGGQVLAQSLVAARRTVADDRPAHSMHAYFLRAGDPTVPIRFSVERLRDGRSFSARRTQAWQGDEPILSMIASFQAPADGVDHQVDQVDLDEVPDPDRLPSLAERYGAVKVPFVRAWLDTCPVDLRHVGDPIYLGHAGERTAHQAVWMRTCEALPDDPALHGAVLAFASDYSVLEPVLRRHGLSWATPGLKVASLDHAMWWHRQARADEWVLYTVQSPSASGARGLGVGRMYSRKGELLCTLAQEGMVRLPQD